MHIGVPKEIKIHESRVGLTPAAVRELVANGHHVMVQKNAGLQIDLGDDKYQGVGAEIVETSPYAALRHACESSDLLVMGTHSKAYWTASLELGRLAHHMLAESACDVLLSPP